MNNPLPNLKTLKLGIGAAALSFCLVHLAYAQTQNGRAADTTTIGQRDIDSDGYQQSRASKISNVRVGSDDRTQTDWARGSQANRSPGEVVVSSYSVPMYKAKD
ncbi:hypothetical protein NK8_83690 (plasmid) [Caballeronia sp. NK8]|uniref:hypothetical protein n=1 Tax=Caballeronia sp. NK8 TaxID=140098 RepID=UPI001BB64EDB|nr:hypothetical protein [Caballeronia sp. NK8]BCQ28634.1 hypothetical protein NK8_68240 [Caballeronia sp. NK8]BCQ30178.1 hypothetical protein NK8_83690 [Caballeronia sp. NK8]